MDNLSGKVLIFSIMLPVCFSLMGCDPYENQPVGGRISVDGEPLQNATVAYVHENMSCDDKSEVATHHYITNGNGWFGYPRKIHKSRIKNYFSREKLCIDRGNGWEIAWEEEIEAYPGNIQFACYGSNKPSDWKCIFQCSYCDHEKIDREFQEITGKEKG